MTTTSRRRDERGSIVLTELLGTIPLFLLVFGAIFQIFLVGQASVEAESAARMTARQLSKGVDEASAAAAGREQASSFFDVEVAVNSQQSGEPEISTIGNASSASASATVPFLGVDFGVDALDLTITRTAVMPDPRTASSAGLP